VFGESHRINALFNTPQPVAISRISRELEALVPPPKLLPDEILEHYQLIRQAILADIAPRSAIDWLLAFDMVELSWDIQRYRNPVPQGLRDLSPATIERALSRIDLVDFPPSLQAEANHYTRLNALSWRVDSVVSTEIELRLVAHGFDQDAINVEVYAQAREPFLMFESLLVSTQNRRTILLRDIANHRHAKQIRKTAVPVDRSGQERRTFDLRHLATVSR
jgi:hypothetical protein